MGVPQPGQTTLLTGVAMNSLQRRVGSDIAAIVYILCDNFCIIGKGTTGKRNLDSRLEYWNLDRASQLGYLLDRNEVRGFFLQSADIEAELKKEGEFFGPRLYVRYDRAFHVL